MKRTKKPNATNVGDDDNFEDHYKSLDDTEKHPEDATGGFFQFPHEMIGRTDHGQRKFLVFYFDFDQEHYYDRMLQLFEQRSSAKRREKNPATVPYMNTDKLVRKLKRVGVLRDRV